MMVNNRMHDQKFMQNQLKCILSDQDEHCDEFGKQLKRKLFFENFKFYQKCIPLFLQEWPLTYFAATVSHHAQNALRNRSVK